jgi:iron complex outermembrane receptor protein
MKRFAFYAALALLCCGTAFAQKTISGTITDENDAPLAGLTIVVEGTKTGAVTNKDGAFALEVPREKINGFIVMTGYGEPRRVAVSSFFQDVPLGIQLLPETTLTQVPFDAITVTATAATAKTPVTYTEVTDEDLAERNLGQDAPYLLKWTPSVVVNADAGTGIGYTGIWIRGSDPTRTNVTINGIPYNDSESQGVFWVNLPGFSSSADNIQIQRGVGTSANGAGAFGATIDFNTNEINEGRRLSVDGSIGSFGTRRGEVNYTSGLLDNGLKIDARYSQIHSEGYVDRASADLEGYYAGLSYVADNGAVWRFNAFGGNEVTYQSWFGVTQDQIDEFGRTYNPAGTEKEGEPYDDETDNYGQRHYQLHYNNAFNNQWTLGISGHYTRGRGYFEQYQADETLADYGINAEVPSSDLIRRLWLDNHFYGTVYSLRYRANEALDFTFGGSANEYLGGHFGEVVWARNAGDSEIRDRYYDNDATKRDFSNYLRTNYGFGSGFNAYLDLQLRHVNYEFLGLDENLNFIDQSASLTFFNPKAGLLYDFGDGQAYASFGVAQREPNRNDFVDNPVSSRPRPERLYNTEVGIRRQSGRFNYGANVYYMDYRDQLVLTGELNDVGAGIRTNVPESYRLGLELQGGLAVDDRLTIGGNLTLSRNRIRNFVEFLDDFDADFNYLGQVPVEREDTPIAFSPSVIGALTLDYNFFPDNARHDLTAGLQAKYVGERFVDNSGDPNAALDAFYYADFRLAYGIRTGEGEAPRIRLTLLVRNITDELYVSNGWSYRSRVEGQQSLLMGMYPQAGRNFLLGLGFDF